MPVIDPAIIGDVPEPGTPEYASWAAQDRRETILVTSWLFLSLATIIVALRIYTRVGIYKYLLADDYWTLAATICGFVSASLSTVAIQNGVGRHFATLSLTQREDVIFWMTIAFVPAAFFSGLPKVAVVALLSRLLKPARWLKWTLWVMVVWSVASLAVFMLLQFARCTPTQSMWNFDIQGECMPRGPIIGYAIYANVFSAFINVVLAVYPAIILARMQMSLKRKVGLTAALGIGAIAGVIAVYKASLIPVSLGSNDFSYDGAALILWTAIEGCTMMIATSMPILAPLIDMMFNNRSRARLVTPRTEAYADLKDESHEMGIRSSRTSESQVDMLQRGDPNKEDRGLGISPRLVAGPGQIICTNEVSITFETQPVDPLEAMIHGYTWNR
ncbi:hypothetical protein S7711_00496 [Stachybotrys chartarum IBT 7711]|uniref:Rhodopsin domain-containing protein n=1 Tax=Stachybotrys chartarum (strain CBS 109288 / IBT 7711) TaxID=1280523 RepID=A0A084B9W0_STACB|nr:hypothetical protein S7711_00496 [Stachybotrys chartarum IBT 7711]KFA53409.1 hypothetical protein S40293_03421 [Stachybotrys chartarum IBT 40293]KFA76121.1 hypothetical protein S40288_00393 [Stachybotrys chartarum IBT 40288]